MARPILALVAVAATATAAVAQPGATVPTTAAPRLHRATVGLMVAQATVYRGSAPNFSDSKIDSNGLVTRVLGVHATYGFRPVGWIELGPRLDVMYTWFRDSPYLPEAMIDVRAALAVAAVVTLGATELRLGLDAGYLASAMDPPMYRGDGASATGRTIGAFVTVGQQRWSTWGWFVDLGGGQAEVDGPARGDYRVESIWLGRLSAGAQAAW